MLKDQECIFLSIKSIAGCPNLLLFPDLARYFENIQQGEMGRDSFKAGKTAGKCITLRHGYRTLANRTGAGRPLTEGNFPHRKSYLWINSNSYCMHIFKA